MTKYEIKVWLKRELEEIDRLLVSTEDLFSRHPDKRPPEILLHRKDEYLKDKAMILDLIAIVDGIDILNVNSERSVRWLSGIRDNNTILVDVWYKDELEWAKESLEKEELPDDTRSELVERIEELEREIAENLDFQQGLNDLIEMITREKEE